MTPKDYVALLLGCVIFCSDIVAIIALLLLAMTHGDHPLAKAIDYKIKQDALWDQLYRNAYKSGLGVKDNEKRKRTHHIRTVPAAVQSEPERKPEASPEAGQTPE